MKLRDHVPGWLLLGGGILSFALTGCESPDQGVVDVTGRPPLLAAVRLLPDSIDLKSLTPVGDAYQIVSVVTATASDPAGTGMDFTVIAEVFKPGSASPFLTVPLLDSGQDPDAAAGDGSFAARIAFSVVRADAGGYRVRVYAVSREGFESSALDRTLHITRINSSPVLSELSAPDTVDLPISGSALIPMSVRATDPDGQADVRQVYFRSLDSSDPTRKFFLKDDGGVDPLSGDRVAGDSIFSIVIQLPSSTPPQTFRFAFQAEDAFGDTSATILHLLTVR